MLFENYRLSSYDEMIDSDRVIRSSWKKVHSALNAMKMEELLGKQKEIDWRLEDNGVTYNVYDDPSGISRLWRLDPIPFVIDESEWKHIEAGLQQRAKILNLLYKDIYSHQKVIQEGILPAEVVFSHIGFLRQMSGITLDQESAIKLYAADLARGPDGKMWIINDRTQAPSGLGYALENRLTMNSVMQDLYASVSVQHLSPFFDALKNMLHQNNSAYGHRENFQVLLSPGPHNETYFEHAYLSSFLGLTLVQGQDLLAKNDGIWLKSLKGLKRVDTILRRVDEGYCDPLELRHDSHLGVAGLVQVVRQGRVTMFNPLGSGVLENFGLNPFMPLLAKYFLNEELLLPQIATWWCGQETECAYVLENLDKLIIKSIDRTGEQPMYIGKRLSASELELLRAKIIEEPSRYVGQEDVQFATTPTLVQGNIEPRKAIVRCFSIANNDQEYTVMPGGLVRVGSTNDSLIVSGQNGGGSKDLCILGVTKNMPRISIFESKIEKISLESLSSLRAENLFWLGRYLTRAITTARLLRTTIKYEANMYRHEHRSSQTPLHALLKSLTHMTMTYPGFLSDVEENAATELWSLVQDRGRVGTLTHTLQMLSNTNSTTKNILPLEAWRIFDRLMKEWNHFTREDNIPSSRAIVGNLDRLLTQLMAYKQLISETLSKEQGLLLYDIGGTIERSLLLISKARSLLTSVYEPVEEYEVVEKLLESCECINSYRAHYRSSFQLHSVVDFLLLDSKFNKSLIYELIHLQKSLPELPKSRHSTHLTSYEKPIFAAYGSLRLSTVSDLCQLNENEFVRNHLDALLSKISVEIMNASNEISHTYFNHYDEQ